MSNPGDPGDIVNWRRLDERVTTSGQPTTDQLAAIAGLGIRHVINLGLHTHERALPDERDDVERLGMIYTHIPVDFTAPTESDFDAFRARQRRRTKSTSTASTTGGSQPSPIAIVAMCSEWTKLRLAPTWIRSGSRAGSGRTSLRSDRPGHS